MKTARFILALTAGVMFAGPVASQDIQPLFIYPNEDQTQEQLDQDHAECEMWTFEQIGFPQGYVASEDAGKTRSRKTLRSALLPVPGLELLLVLWAVNPAKVLPLVPPLA